MIGLIDADIVAMQHAMIHRPYVDVPDEVCDIYDSEWALDACEHAESTLIELMDWLGLDDVVLCWSDPGRRYFRHDIFPAYKGHRKQDKPRYAANIRAWLEERYTSQWWPKLEADDVMGILATSGEYAPCVIVSSDKDMLTIPNVSVIRDMAKPKDGRRFPKMEVTTVASAHRWHMIQTLMGDSTDGIPGIFKMGEKHAVKVVDATSSRWSNVVRAYEDAINEGGKLRSATKKDAGSTRACPEYAYEQAVLNARLTNILTNEQYERDTGKVTLWRPL